MIKWTGLTNTDRIQGKEGEEGLRLSPGAHCLGWMTRRKNWVAVEVGEGGVLDTK